MRRSRPEKLIIVNHHERNNLKKKMDEFDKEKERRLRKISSSQDILLNEIVATEYCQGIRDSDVSEITKRRRPTLSIKYRENTQNRSEILDIRRSRINRPDLMMRNHPLEKVNFDIDDQRRSSARKYSLPKNARSISQLGDFKTNRDSKSSFAIIENTSSLVSSVSDLSANGLSINNDETSEGLCELKTLKSLKPCQKPEYSAEKCKTRGFQSVSCDHIEPRMFEESFNLCKSTNINRTTINKEVDRRLRNHSDEGPTNFESDENGGVDVEKDKSEARSRIRGGYKRQRRKIGVQHDFFELPIMCSRNIPNNTACDAADNCDKAGCKLLEKEQFLVSEQRSLSAYENQEFKIQTDKASNSDCGENKEGQRIKQEMKVGSCKLTRAAIEDVTIENRKLLRYHRNAWTGEDESRQGLSGNKQMDVESTIRRSKSENNITKAESSLKPGLKNLRRLTLKAMAINTFNNLKSKDGEEIAVNCKRNPRTESEMLKPDNGKSQTPKFRQLGIATVTANTLATKCSKPTPTRKISLERLKELQKPTQSSLRQSVGGFILPAKPTMPRKLTHSVSDPSSAECSPHHQALASFRKQSHASRISSDYQHRGCTRTMPMTGEGPGCLEDKNLAATIEDLKRCRYLRN